MQIEIQPCFEKKRNSINYFINKATRKLVEALLQSRTKFHAHSNSDIRQTNFWYNSNKQMIFPILFLYYLYYLAILPYATLNVQAVRYLYESFSDSNIW